MIDLFSNEIASTLTLGGTLGILVTALVIGLFISVCYMYTHRNDGYSGSFTITLIMLPAIVAIIILLIGSNVARAFSLVGAFSLVRFRSAPGDSEDISYAFFSLGIGLACGMGYLAYAVVFAIVLCGVMILLKSLKFGMQTVENMRLKIVIPEDLDYQGIFDEILSAYTTSYKLLKVKTSEFGSLFELTYNINLKEKANSKELIDNLRCKNGNLNIILSVNESKVGSGNGF